MAASESGLTLLTDVLARIRGDGIDPHFYDKYREDSAAHNRSTIHTILTRILGNPNVQRRLANGQLTVEHIAAIVKDKPHSDLRFTFFASDKDAA
jgi:hypothetical protein